MTTAPAWSFTAPSPSTTNICSPSPTRSRTRAASPSALHPYALILRRGKPDVSGYSVLHEGFVGVHRRQFGPGNHLSPRSRRRPAKARELKGAGGWLGFTDKYWASAIIPDQSDAGRRRVSRSAASPSPSDYQTDFLGDARVDRARRDERSRLACFRRRQGSRHDRRLRSQSRHQEIRSDDRLGLVLFHHQAVVQADRLHLQDRRQFRRGDPHRHRARQARLLPARQPQLRLDGEDEEDPAADRRA